MIFAAKKTASNEHAVRADRRDGAVRVALLFRKIVLGGNDEAEIPNAGGIKPGRIDLVENAVADGEPDLAFGARGRAYRALGTRGPARTNARRPRRHDEIGQPSPFMCLRQA